MKDDEDNHDLEHQEGVKHVCIVLMTLEYAGLPLSILDDSVDASDHDHSTSEVKDEKIPLPVDGACNRLCGRIGNDPFVKDDRDDNKKSKEEDLDKKTDDNDVFSKFHLACRFRTRKYGTAYMILINTKLHHRKSVVIVHTSALNKKG